MVSGHSPPEDIMQDLPLETQNICSTLASVSQQHSEAHPNDITVEAFKSLYTALDERTLSSPLGRHLGHYKAATQSEKLSTLHSQLMLIPSITGISPTRWHQTVDIMLEKKPSDHRIHRIQIIALQESDLIK
jgi:hypothetical protein